VYQNVYLEHVKERTFQVHLWDDEVGYSCFPYNDFDYAYRIDKNGSTMSLHGKMVKKVRRWKKDDPHILESDLPKETRVLTDLYLESDDASKGHTVLLLDIEVDSKSGLPDTVKANKEITSIALKDKTTNEEYVFILDPEGELDDYKLDAENLTIYNCRTEEELLADFLDTWEEINPTIITGWNIDYFDVPYLYKRISESLGIEEALRLSPIHLIQWSERKNMYRIAGISALDYLDLYKKFTYTEQPNYRLDTIGKIEVDLGKLEFEGTLDELFENDIEAFLEYNLRDVHIVDKLDNKMKFIELVRGICTVGHVPYEDYDHSSRWLEGALITDLHRKGIIAPNRPTGMQERMDELSSGVVGFAGAYVKPPKVGRHEWVFSLDLQSLYPSLIMSLNISPETKAGKIVNWDIEQHIQKRIEIYIVEDIDGKQVNINREKFLHFMKDGAFTLSSNGIIYRTDKEGLLAEILDRWFVERVEYKDNMKEAAQKGDTEQEEYWDMRQHIQKIFLNSLYGVLGLPVFRFYDLDNALAVTASGQDVIKTSAKYVNGKFNEMRKTDEDYCIYIDTDSVYFSALAWYGDVPHWKGHLKIDPDEAKKATIDLAQQMESELNKFYDAMAQRMFFIQGKHRFVIKGETVASTAFWVNKKRYAMRKVYDLETGQDVNKVTIKGLDVVRSSFPAAFRKFMKEVLGDILDHIPRDELDAKIIKFKDQLPSMPIPDVARNTAVKNVSKWETTDQQLGIYQSGTPAHVKASLNYNMLLRHMGIHTRYRPITNGSKIKWVYLKDNPYKVEAVAFNGDDTDPPAIAKLVKDYIDYDKLFEKEFAHKLQDFYAALKWGKIPTEVNQLASEFFSF